MQLLYTSDTHVYPGHLNRLLKAAAQLEPGAVIVGGDINPNWKGRIADSIEPHKKWMQDKLVPRLERFHDEFPHIPVLLDLGNDDIAAARYLLEAQDGKILHLLHMRVIKLSETLAAVGYMTVNPTPFSIKDGEKPDCHDRYGLTDSGVARSGFTTASGEALPHVLDPAGGTIEDDLKVLSETLASGPWKNSDFVFVSHSPPRETALDLTSTGLHVGSLAVRRFIEQWSSTGRLVASFHGHIHESPWMSGKVRQPIGGVPCFNVGQRPEVLRALLIDTEQPLVAASLIRVDRAGEVFVSGIDEKE